MTTIRGTSASETLRGTAGADTIYGNGGGDIIYGGAGDDILIGGSGNDVIRSGSGDDWVRATVGDGSDQIYGSKGADRIELTIGDVIHYSSYQQSGQGFGVDSVTPQSPLDPWTIDFTGFDANLLLEGQQKLTYVGVKDHPATGQLSIITSDDFLHIPLGIGANLDADPDLEFFVWFTWEFQGPPHLIL